MGDVLYMREKFYVAVDALAGDGSIKDRVMAAFTSFHPIRAVDFDDPDMRGKYEKIIATLTAVKDGPTQLGYVQNTLNRISDHQAAETSRQIVELAFEIYGLNTGV